MGRHTTFPLLLMFWLVYLALGPTWTGRMYHADPVQPAKYVLSGTFGLQDDASVRPLWNPPQPYSDGIEATVRYPWQPVHQPYHIEIETSKLVRDFTLGTMTLGFMIGFWHLLTRQQQKNDWIGIPSATWTRFIAYVTGWLLVGMILPGVAQHTIPFTTVAVLGVLFCLLMVAGLPRVTVSIAWGMSLALAFAWIVILVLAILSSGYILSADLLLTAIPVAAMALGGVVGFYLHHRRGVSVILQKQQGWREGHANPATSV